MAQKHPQTGDDVYVGIVSLKRATGRRALMAKELQAARLPTAFFDAVDASTEEGAARVKALPEFYRFGRFQTHDRACTLSHLFLLDQFLESGLPFCLVLEDDAFISPDISAWLADMSWWPDGADIVKFERWRDDRFYVATARREQFHLGRRISRLFSKHSGGAGYVISRNAALVLRAKPPIALPIDHMLFNNSVSPVARSMRIFQVIPALTVQGNEPPGNPNGRRQNKLGPVPKSAKLWRLYCEVNLVPRLLALVLLGRARAERIDWAATCLPELSETV